MIVHLLFVGQLFPGGPKMWAPQYMDSYNEITISSASSELRMDNPSGLSIRQLEKNLSMNWQNCIAWKVLLETSLNSDNGDSFIDCWSKSNERAVRNHVLFYRWRLISSYLATIVNYRLEDTKEISIKKNKSWSTLLSTESKDFYRVKEYQDAFLMMIGSSEADFELTRLWGKVFIDQFPASYYIKHWYVNSFRLGRIDREPRSDIKRFRSESLLMSKKFPKQPTPHFTVAMTFADHSVGLTEAREYLRLENRPLKETWRKMLLQKYPELKK